MPADTIHLCGLKAATRVGVPEEERARPQTVEFHLILEPLRGLAGLGDSLAATVDYAAVAEQVTALAVRGERRLIETLAEEAADLLLAGWPLRAVEVEVRKFILPHCHHVAVRLRKEAATALPTHAAIAG